MKSMRVHKSRQKYQHERPYDAKYIYDQTRNTWLDVIAFDDAAIKLLRRSQIAQCFIISAQIKLNQMCSFKNEMYSLKNVQIL